MKIYDGFIFFNELDLLELRLMTLDKIVDYFVIIEANMTHTGNPKEYVLNKEHPLLKKYGDKIRYIQTTLPYKNQALANEVYQRNMIMEGVKDAEPDDYIMISDLDEIPHPDGIMDGINNHKWERFIMEQKLTYYYINCLTKLPWHGTVVLKKKLLRSPQITRDVDRRNPPCVIKEGGWHYSFLGNEEQIREKLEAYSEVTTNKDVFKSEEHLAKCRATGADLFNRDNDWRCVKTFDSLAEMGHDAVNEWLKIHPQYVKEL